MGEPTFNLTTIKDHIIKKILPLDQYAMVALCGSQEGGFVSTIYLPGRRFDSELADRLMDLAIEVEAELGVPIEFIPAYKGEFIMPEGAP